jgi:phospholipid transport system substrate-binding protein
MLGAGGAWATAADSPAQAVVRATTEKVLQTMRAEGDGLRDNPKRLFAIVDELIIPHFDFREMSQWVLGRYWRQASPAQRDAFVEQFQNLLVRTYSRALVDYRDEQVSFLAPRVRDASTVIVRASIDRGGGPPIPINYEMHKTDAGWKVFDVVIDGVSLVITYRSSFGQEIKRNGMDGLIRRMSEKNRSENG